MVWRLRERAELEGWVWGGLGRAELPEATAGSRVSPSRLPAGSRDEIEVGVAEQVMNPGSGPCDDLGNASTDVGCSGRGHEITLSRRPWLAWSQLHHLSPTQEGWRVAKLGGLPVRWKGRRDTARMKPVGSNGLQRIWFGKREIQEQES